MTGRASWAAGTGVLLVALLAVVSFAAGQPAPAGGGPARAHGLPPAFFDYAWTFLLLAAVPLGLLLLYARGRSRKLQSGSELKRLLAVIAVYSVAAIVLLVFRPHIQIPQTLADNSVPIQGGKPAAATHGAHRGGAQPRNVRFKWIPVAALAVGALAVGATAWALSRRRRPEAPAPLAEELAAALALGIDDLRGEDDPRTAVIAAYARMERVLGAHGVPRAPADSPLEYLGRVLRELHVRTAAVLGLTQLFERAKFSPHAVDAGMKAEAIDALEAVREDLAVSA